MKICRDCRYKDSCAMKREYDRLGIEKKSCRYKRG